MTASELKTFRTFLREEIRQSIVQEISHHGNNNTYQSWRDGTLCPGIQNEFPDHFPVPITSDQEKEDAIREIMVRDKTLLKSITTNREKKERKELQSKEKKAKKPISSQNRHAGKHAEEPDREDESKETENTSSAAKEAFGTAEVFETIRYGHHIKGRTVNECLVEDEWNALDDHTSEPTIIDGEESSSKLDTPKPGDGKLCVIETRRVRTVDNDGFAEYGISKVRLGGILDGANAGARQNYGPLTKGGRGLSKRTGSLNSEVTW